MSCDLVLPPESEELCNTQHASSECYLKHPSDLLAVSINDYSIRLSIHFPDTMKNIPDSVKIQRDDPKENTLFFVTPYDSLDLRYTDTTFNNSFLVYIDSTITDTGNYIYTVTSQDINGNSINSDIVQIYHNTSLVNDLSHENISCHAIPLSWNYEIPSDWEEIVALRFLIERISVNSNIRDTMYYETEPSSTSSYEYSDSNFAFDLNYTYTIKYQGIENNSKEATLENVIISFPETAIFNWIPISSDRIYIEWEIGSDANMGELNALDSVIIIRDDEIIKYSTNATKQGHFSDSLDMAYSVVKYKVRWSCGESRNVDSTFITATLPYHNMVYIAADSISNYAYEDTSGHFEGKRDTIVNQLDAFYIDLYEMPEEIFLDPTINSPMSGLIEKMPKDNISYTLAKSWAVNDREPEVLGSCSDDLLSVSFRLPKDYEWQIASRCKYDYWSGRVCSEMWDYPYPLKDQPPTTCTYVNCNQCCSSPPPACTKKIVDYYLESKGPFGLFGTSGNLQEWVENTIMGAPDNSEKLMGGSFGQLPEKVSTRWTAYHDKDFINPSFGFRTVFNVSELDQWKECIENLE